MREAIFLHLNKYFNTELHPFHIKCETWIITIDGKGEGEKDSGNFSARVPHFKGFLDLILEPPPQNSCILKFPYFWCASKYSFPNQMKKNHSNSAQLLE